MAECYLCKNGKWGYGGYSDGGCDHLKERPLPKAEDGVCKYLELIDKDTCERILRFDEAHSSEMYNVLSEVIKKREENG